MQKYELITTDDGSYSLIGQDTAEAMHARMGAFSETEYIYGTAMNELLSWQLSNPKVVSVGFGLGYNEILLAAKYEHCYGEKADYHLSPTLELTSCETNSDFYALFLQWLLQGLQNDLSPAYADILNRACHQEGVSPARVKMRLQSWAEQGQWRQLSSVSDLLTQPIQKFNCILYDLYSAKTTQLFWEQSFLTELFSQTKIHPCVFTTYAATGNLNRALKANKFTVHKKAGFGFKRQSTYALALDPEGQQKQNLS